MISFFKNRRPKQFQFKPVYYDPKKETERKPGDPISFKGGNYSEEMYNRWDRTRYDLQRKANQKRVQRMLVLAIAISLLLGAVIYFKKLEGILQ